MGLKFPNVQIYHDLLAQAKSQTRLFQITLGVAIATLIVAAASLIIAFVALSRT